MGKCGYGGFMYVRSVKVLELRAVKAPRLRYCYGSGLIFTYRSTFQMDN